MPAGGAPRRTRVADRARGEVPSGFRTTSIFDFVTAGLGIAGGAYVALASQAVAVTLRGREEPLQEGVDNAALAAQFEALASTGSVFILAGVVALIMGILVRRGSPDVQQAQRIVSVVLLGVAIWGMAEGWIGVVTLGVLAAQAAALFVMFQERPLRRGP